MAYICLIIYVWTSDIALIYRQQRDILHEEVALEVVAC